MPRKQTQADKQAQETLKAGGEIPRHIAVIMDGNGRWAKKRGLPRNVGHRNGIESVRDIIETCAQLGVGYLTLYTFSTENWRRPKNEVDTLMRLMLSALRKETDEINENDVRVRVLGDVDAVPDAVRGELLETIRLTSNNSGLTLRLALSYSGRWEIARAAKRLAIAARDGEIDPETIDENAFAERLEGADAPDPDLLIRSGGEFRVSNFLLWQIAYAEIYVADVLWPDFRRKHLYEAIEDFRRRERRFGKVSEQLQEEK
ncbi:MAG: isoprenyl transferase [Ignavibacteriales bacterium]|nr:isoprenyl transferase [Ignavibacteriales bacterium]